MRKGKRSLSLHEKYPPSLPCSCAVCRAYCLRPGWWTVEEAAAALEAGYWTRMMLEISPERTFLVLSPAFRGCEQKWATQRFAYSRCTFLRNERCELFGTGHQPLECRFCHHTRKGLGQKCHADLELDWNTLAGQALVGRWLQLTGLLE